MISYYQINSPLSENLEENLSDFIRLVEQELGEELRRVELQDYLAEPFALLYVASGGSESRFLDVYGQMNGRMCYILTSGESNSLAASMEILSYLKGRGGSGKIFHGDVSSVSSEILALRDAHRALLTLRGKTLGCIGAPSSWLIASDYDAETVQRKLGLGFLQIPMEELFSEIAQNFYTENEYTEQLKSAAFDREEVERALYIYGAFQRLVDRYDLYGVSVRCFDLLDTVHSTGCLGLSILNSCGVYGGCEGDMPSLLSMAILGSVTGEDLFMCNPSRFDTKMGRATFAHCTIPVTMPKRFQLDTHFESGIGVAVRGEFEQEDCTIFKCSGDLSRHFVTEAPIVDAPYSEKLCRTQITVGIEDFDYFLTDPIGNHHIICKGNNKAKVDAFFGLLQ